MSKILENIREQMTGRIKPTEFIRIDRKIEDQKELLGYEGMYEYSIEAKFGGKVTCEKKDLNRAIDNIFNSLRKEIYGDFESLVLQAERALYEEDKDKLRMLLREMLRETGIN